MTTAELKEQANALLSKMKVEEYGITPQPETLKQLTQTFATFLEELELPRDHEDHDIPFDYLDAQEIGEVIGYEECAEECRRAIQTVANELKGQSNE